MNPKIKAKGKGKYIIITPDCKEIPFDDVDALFQFKDGYAVYRIRDPKKKYMRRYGFVDAYGNKLSDKVYDHADNFVGKYARVKNGNKQNLVDHNGHEILSWNYANVEPFINDTFLVNFYQKDNTKNYWGLVDVNENFIIAAMYDTKIEVIIEAKKHFKEIVDKE